jgi:hypothetical protein
MKEGHGEMWMHQFMTSRISLQLLFSAYHTYFLLTLNYFIVVVLHLQLLTVYIDMASHNLMLRK